MYSPQNGQSELSAGLVRRWYVEVSLELLCERQMGFSRVPRVKDSVTTMVKTTIRCPYLAMAQDFMVNECSSGFVSLFSIIAVRESAEVWFEVSKYMFPGD
jgi:hypothetical protein